MLEIISSRPSWIGASPPFQVEAKTNPGSETYSVQNTRQWAESRDAIILSVITTIGTLLN